MSAHSRHEQPVNRARNFFPRSLLIALVPPTGITVAAVVHQPRDEIWRLFDTVLVLGVGGRTVYFGPRKAAAAHFEHLWFARPEWGMYLCMHVCGAVS